MKFLIWPVFFFNFYVFNWKSLSYDRPLISTSIHVQQSVSQIVKHSKNQAIKQGDKKSNNNCMVSIYTRRVKRPFDFRKKIVNANYLSVYNCTIALTIVFFFLFNSKQFCNFQLHSHNMHPPCRVLGLIQKSQSTKTFSFQLIIWYPRSFPFSSMIMSCHSFLFLWGMPLRRPDL